MPTPEAFGSAFQRSKPFSQAPRPPESGSAAYPVKDKKLAQAKFRSTLAKIGA